MCVNGPIFISGAAHRSFSCRKLNKGSYVDDVATGGMNDEVDRMAGVYVGGNNEFETDSTLSKIL